MNATWVVTVFEIIDTIMEGVDHRSHVVAHVPDAEVFTVAVVAGDRASGVAGAVGAGAGQAGGVDLVHPVPRVQHTGICAADPVD
jgi:hypothetical protein